MLKTIKTVFALSAMTLMTACGGGGGGGSVYSCFGSGSSYLCSQVGSGGGSSTPEPSAQPFPVAASIAALVSTGLSASGLYSNPYTAAGTYTLDKTRTTTTYNGIAVTQIRTTTNWTGGYPAPYNLYFDSNNQLYGFQISGVYGLRTGGSANPTSVNDGGTGTLGTFNLFSNSNLTTGAGTATLTYEVKNCCSLYDKVKADLLLTITANNTTNNLLWTLKQKFVITTTGGITFGYDKFTDTATSKEIYHVYGGY